MGLGRNITIWINPILDRTQADVDRVKELKSKSWEEMTASEKLEWSSDLKGALNYSDLERIENNIHLISEVAELDLITYEDDIPTIPNASYWNNLLTNVQTIRDAYSTFGNTPQCPVAPINTFQKLNDIEKILSDVYSTLMSNFYYESIDEITMGDEIGLIL